MNLEKHLTPKTITAIYEHYQRNRKNEHRPHLGGSQIGKTCDRELWYQFRHCATPDFPGRVLRLFETGDREESRIVRNLRDVGVTVWDKDPETGKQIRYTECAGHFALSLDGVVTGLAESGQPHTVEMKTANDKNFRVIKNKGVQESKPVYFLQCQVGMHLADIDRCLFIAVNKNDDELYMERIHRDRDAGAALVARAEAIIFAANPPARISNDPAWYECKFCTFHDICHIGRLPEVNCRTCVHATPERTGTDEGVWSCASGREFGKVCEKHLFIPSLTPWGIEDAGDDWIDYLTDDGEVIRNGGGNSETLREEQS